MFSRVQPKSDACQEATPSGSGGDSGSTPSSSITRYAWTRPRLESRTVTFETPVGQLGFHDRELRYAVEPGRIDVLVGSSSADLVDPA